MKCPHEASRGTVELETPSPGLCGMKLFLASEPVQKVASEGFQLFQQKMEELQTACLRLTTVWALPAVATAAGSGHSGASGPLGLARGDPA